MRDVRCGRYGGYLAHFGGDRALLMVGSRDPVDCRFLPDEGDGARSCRRTCAVIVGWMTTHLRRLTIPGQDPAALARFWGGVLLRPVIDGSDGLHLQMVEGNEPQALYFTQAVAQSVPDGGPFLSVGALCGTLADEVERLVRLGAAFLHDSPGDPRSVTMADPEGHQFMVELSDEELLDDELDFTR
ncbi:VOC family protein [Streptomyces sp. NPDC048650]|uniref:VOC family protein n=1 Tax=Streptomyces sp. NPDC048650 TaxID=3365583 RepID=UPI00371501BC